MILGTGFQGTQCLQCPEETCSSMSPQGSESSGEEASLQWWGSGRCAHSLAPGRLIGPHPSQQAKTGQHLCRR